MPESRRIIRLMNEFAEREIGKLQLRVFQTVTSATPVDTGYARGAWAPSTGNPEDGPAEAPSDRAAATSEGSRNFALNQSLSRAIADSYRFSNGPIWISNNVPYIGILNAGSSSQAPARFVEKAIETAIRG